MSEKKKQTEAGMRGEPVVRVPLTVGRPAPASGGGAYGTGQRVGEAIRREASRGAALTMDGLSQAPVVGPLVTGARALSQQPVRVGIRSFFEGLAGAADGSKASKAAAAVPAKPVEQALSQGRSARAQAAAAPNDPVGQMLSAILASGLTVNEAATVAGMLPAAGKPASAKDTVMSQAAKLSEALFQNEINQATELAKTDPDAAKAVVEKATAAHFQRQAGLVGFNPVQLAQAALMGGAAEEE